MSTKRKHQRRPVSTKAVQLKRKTATLGCPPMLLMQELSTTAAGKKTISDIHESSYENIIAEQRNSVKGKFSVAEETKTAWNTDKEQRDIDEFLKVNPDWAQTLAEIRKYAEGKAFELPEMANAESTSAGGITEAAKATGAVTPTIDSASGISITENGMPVKGKFSVAEETKTAWNTDKEQRDIDEFLKVNPDWAQTLAEIRKYADGKAAQHIHIKYDGIGLIPLNGLMKKETA